MQVSIFPSYLFIFLSLFLFACDSSEEEHLETEIESLIKMDNKISADDFSELRNLVNNLKLELYENPTNLCDKITEIAEKTGAGTINIECPSGQKTVEGGGKKKRSRSSRDKKNSTISENENGNNNNANSSNTSRQNTNTDVGYQVYVENSGSMFGYMTGNTAFKENVFDLLSRIDREQEKMLVSFINNKAYPILATDTSFTANNRTINPEIVKNNITDFMKFINPSEARKHGDVSSSELNKIFKKVVEQIVEDGKTAIIVSDCIYSLSSAEDVLGGLANQKFATKVIFQEESFRQQHSVLMIQSESHFDGKYYDYANPNKGISLKGTRPFYTWIIGRNENMVDFVEKYDIKSLKGYKNHVFFMDTENGDVPYYSILPNTKKVGRSRIVRTKRDNEQGITALENIKYNERYGIFQFSVGIDLSKIPAHENYLTNATNYEITSSKDDIFDVVGVEKVSTAIVSDKDKKYTKTATHFITLGSDDISTSEQKLTISLKKQIPEWVTASSNTDDTKIKNTLSQTFGLSYLISGVSEAYDPKGQENKYISIDLKLRR